MKKILGRIVDEKNRTLVLTGKQGDALLEEFYAVPDSTDVGHRPIMRRS